MDFRIAQLLIILWAKETNAQGTSNIRLEKHEVCPGVSNEVIFFTTPKNFNRGQQIFDFNATLPYPLGQNVVVEVKLEKESPVLKNSWIPLISFDVKEGFCVALEKYLGEFGFAMERAVGIPPKECPLPKGIYHADNFLADFTKLRLPIMPNGRTKVILAGYHKEKKQIVSCHVFILSSL